MSVNVKVVEALSKNVEAAQASVEKLQAKAEGVLQKSIEHISDKYVGELVDESNIALDNVAQLTTDAQDLLSQADSLNYVIANGNLSPELIESNSREAIALTEQAGNLLDQAKELLKPATENADAAKELVNSAVDSGSWIDMLLMTGIGFAVVFGVLVLLIYIMKGMGWAFTRQKKAEKVAKATAAGVTLSEDDHHEAITDEEIAAAIITALKLYKSNLHDQESEMLTIHRITRAYSPWSSKIHGLTQLPERK